MSMKHSSDTIGNRTRDLPAVPQPTAPRRAPSYVTINKQFGHCMTKTLLLVRQHSYFIAGGLLHRKALRFSATGGLVYAVNGPTSPQIPVRGFTLDPLSGTALDRWGTAAVSIDTTQRSKLDPFKPQTRYSRNVCWSLTESVHIPLMSSGPSSQNVCNGGTPVSALSCVATVVYLCQCMQPFLASCSTWYRGITLLGAVSTFTCL
jgi:hypothetical protein